MFSASRIWWFLWKFLQFYTWLNLRKFSPIFSSGHVSSNGRKMSGLPDPTGYTGLQSGTNVVNMKHLFIFFTILSYLSRMILNKVFWGAWHEAITNNSTSYAWIILINWVRRKPRHILETSRYFFCYIKVVWNFRKITRYCRIVV